MSSTLPAGPYRTMTLDNGKQAPFYVIPFDEQGRCQGPLTYNRLLTDIQNGSYTDIFLFSHGWNNTWPDAIGSYEGFIQGYTQMRHDHGLTYQRPFQPLLIGIFWPSIILVSPQDSAPAFAGGTSDALMDTAVALEQQAVRSLAEIVDDANVERFYVLAQKESGLNRDEALELARMLAPLYNIAEDEIPAKDAAPPISAEELVELWEKSFASTDISGKFGFADEAKPPSTGLGSAGGSRSAGIFDFLDPTMIIRAATVLQMKDRAGVVGAHGVGKLLVDILKTPAAHVHLIGHSYGCKVLLSALCFPELPRKVASVLLLQPAISYLCFAPASETGTGRDGGYRVALDRVEHPIMTTFSSHDVPLTQFFHLAVRRPFDIGEQNIAGVPPGQYAALGGFGPGGCGNDCLTIDIKPVGQTYNLTPDLCKIYALNSSQAISGHGDISNPFTWWALYEQVVS